MGNFVVVCFVVACGGLRAAYSQISVTIDETAFKASILGLIEASEDNFESIKGDIDTENAGFFPKLMLRGARRCSIRSLENGLNVYHCEWFQADNVARGNAETQRLVQLVKDSVPSEWSAHIQQKFRYDSTVKKFEFYQDEYRESVQIHTTTYEGRYTSGMLIQIMISPSILDFIAKKQGADPVTKKTTQKAI